MELRMPTWERILELLQKHAIEDEISLIIEARIAISPEGTFVLDLKPNRRLQTIRY